MMCVNQNIELVLFCRNLNVCSSSPSSSSVFCCCVVVYSPGPEVSFGDIVGYDVRFYSPQLLTQNVTRHNGANQTFYIIQDEDRLDANQKDLYVQVML